MVDQKYTDEQLKEAIISGMSVNKFCEKYGVNARGVQRRKAKLIQKGFSPENDWIKEAPDGYKVSGTTTLYKCGLDEYGNALRTPTNQWVKVNEDKERQLEILKEMCESFVTELPKLDPIPLENPDEIQDDLLAVYPLGDPHIGMMAWGKETGENWDLKIAEKVFCQVFDRAVRSTPNCGMALIVNLGDFFHYDNEQGTTSRHGNVLDRDGRYAKMVAVGIKIMRQMIVTALEKHARVRVINCIGNHDDVGSIFLSICLKHVYENEPRVEIDDNPSVFNYYRFGKVLIGAHHGHLCRMEQLPGIMATDRAKDWGDTEARYWLTGHIHQDSKKIAQEYAGCVVESFRTIAAPDAYAFNNGYRSGRDLKAIVYHKDYGERDRHITKVK